MSVMDLMTRLREAGVRLTVADGKIRLQAAKGKLTPELQQEISQHKAEIISLLAPATADTPALISTDRTQPLPLSYAQQRLWFLDELEPGTPIYNMPFAVQLTGVLDQAALQAAVNAVIARHETLRTVFPTVNEQAVQTILPALELTAVFEALPDASAAQLEARATELAQLGFTLATGPLLRVHVLTAGPEQHMLVLVLHHIISDLWSMDVLFRDLSSYYALQLQSDADEPQPLAVQYGDYAVWQHQLLDGQRLDSLTSYWRQRLQDAPPRLELPLDFARPAEPGYKGNWLAVRLPQPLVVALDKLTAATGCTLFMANMAVFALLLSRYSRTADLVIGTPISGRQHTELEALVGFFLNTLAVRLEPDATLSFREFLQQVRTRAVEAFEHQELPFEKLVEELQPDRDMSHTPIFQHMFICQDSRDNALALPGLQVAPATLISHGTAKFDLTLAITRDALGIELGVEYSTDLYAASSIERLQRHYLSLLTAITANPDQPLSHYSLLDQRERDHVLGDFSAGPQLTDTCAVVHRAVEAQAQTTPDAPAVIWDRTALTYAELNGRANALARQLQSLGAGPGTRVALACERSLELAIAVLAIVKSGACYVPIDPTYPGERVAAMLTDCAAQLCLTHDSSAFADTGVSCLAVSDFDYSGARDDLPDTAAASDALYCIYTSGSTGAPKGVQLSHAGLGNLLAWQRSDVRLSAAAKTLQFASFSFDVSFQECFGAWTTGGCIQLVTADLRQDLPELARFIVSADIERLYLPFAALQPLAECFLAAALPAALRDVVVAGEALRITPELRQLFAGLPMARLHNHYGPSETHVVTALTLSNDPHSWPALPAIGTPVANTQCYVLDENLQPAAIGTPGELCIGGIQVGIGYWNRPDLTTEKFVASPFIQNERLYRTGDSVRWLDSGALEYLGRCDEQIKWRGFRVEPGEIEAALSEFATVSQAVVVLREDTPGVAQLVGYVTAAAAATLDVANLRDSLRQTLPDYMIPSALVALDALPLTPSGKVARRRLPPPPAEARQTAGYQPPRNADEALLTKIWADVLGVPKVGIEDDFFELGGHSLLATKVISRIGDQFGTRLPLKYLFRYPTPAQLGAAVATLRQAQHEAPQSSQEDRDEFRI